MKYCKTHKGQVKNNKNLTIIESGSVYTTTKIKCAICDKLLKTTVN